MSTVWQRLLVHLRRQALGYLALAVALSGTAYAASKLGPNDIANNAIRSKHIAAKQVKKPDANAKSLSKLFGAGVLGGEVEGFGAGANVGLISTIAPMGRWAGGADTWQFVAPKKVRARQIYAVRLAGAVPAGRVVVLAIRRNPGAPDFKEVRCTIPAGAFKCRSKGKLVFKRGDILGAQLRSPAGPNLPSSTFLFGYRLTP